MAVYYKDIASSCSATNIEGTELVTTQLKNVNLCFFYCPSKQVTQHKFANMLKVLPLKIPLCQPTVLMGDFNQNALESNTFSQLIEKYSFIQILKSETTDYHSCLDHVYINFTRSSLVSWGVLESYYSDHKPIYVCMKL